MSDDIPDQAPASVTTAPARRRLEWLFAQAGVGIEETDTEGRITEVSLAMRSLLGYRRRELVGRRLDEITYPDDVAREGEIVRRMMRGEIPGAQFEKRYVCRSGQIVWARVTSCMSRLGAEDAFRVSVVEDITARKKAEEESRESHARFRATFEQAAVGMAHVSLDGHWLRANARLLEMTGYAAHEFPNLAWRDVTHAEDVGREEALIAQLLSGAIPSYGIDKRYIHKSGALCWVHVTRSLVRGEDGRPLYFISVVEDIEDRKRAERALKEREALLRSILDTAPEALITIDENACVTSFSRSAESLFGYRAEEVVGRNVKVLMPSPYRNRDDEYVRRFLRSGKRRMIGVGRMVRARKKDGTVFPIELAVGAADAQGGRVFTGFIRDLTERQKIEQDLRQAQKMEAIGQLTGGVAHDFNNLLTVILGNLEMLEGLNVDPHQAVLLKEARETAEHGARLTQRLLAFGRRQPLQPRLTNVATTLAEIAPILRRTLGESIRVRARSDFDLHFVKIDPSQLQNAILNLAINARDAMHNGGELTITAENVHLDEVYARTHSEVAPGQYVSIAVTDTGSGMSRQVQERAFEPFFTTKEDGAGSGLGLSMVYGFAKQSGGHLAIYSEIGHGTTVRLYLPMVKPHPGEAASATSETPLGALAGQGEKVLVVEDDARVRRVTVARVHSLGYRVIEAAGGVEALARLDDHPDLALLFTDMVMRGNMNGADLARRAQEKRPGLKVLLTSGYAEPEMMREDSIESAHWLRKPSTLAELARSIREALT